MVSMCGCLRCQRRTGSAFALASRWRADAVAVSGEFKTFERPSDTGNVVQLRFCPQCGTTVLTSLAIMPDTVGIPVGCFADPTFGAPTVAVWCESLPPWIRPPEGILALQRQG
jgi:hypothetical protein